MFRWRRLKIFFYVRVRETAIVQVQAQLRRGKRASRKQSADRFKDYLMLGLDERVLAEGLQQPFSFLARGRSITKRTKGLELGCELRFSIHADTEVRVRFLSLKIAFHLRE
jgi:hypothetical protein